MTKISRQLGEYFILIGVLSIVFITIITNISINLFFSSYVRENRCRDDLKIVKYIEQIYSDNKVLGSRSLMNIMHYAHSEAVEVRLRNREGSVVWSSEMSGHMDGIMGEDYIDDNHLIFKSYPFRFEGKQIGIIEVGRPKTIITTLGDKKFLRTINAVFIIAFIFSVTMAVFSSSHIAKKFLRPIYLIKENTRLIEKGDYKKLNQVKTNTYELYDLSVSVKELAERLEYQDTLRKRLTSDVAHELRTPLATIQSHIEAFMDRIWEPDAEKLSLIHDEISRLTKLIKALSDLSLVESDEVKLYKKKVNLSALLNNIVEGLEPMLIGKNIELHKEIQKNIYLIGDPDRLNQIFVNLLSNACKYTNENGDVLVSLQRHKDTVKITIEDTGIGISQENIKHIFERFYRADLSRNRKTGGTGIGLTITKALVEAHNGRITIQSHEGKGTKVTVEFHEDEG